MVILGELPADIVAHTCGVVPALVWRGSGEIHRARSHTTLTRGPLVPRGGWGWARNTGQKHSRACHHSCPTTSRSPCRPCCHPPCPHQSSRPLMSVIIQVHSSGIVASPGLPLALERQAKPPHVPCYFRMFWPRSTPSCTGAAPTSPLRQAQSLQRCRDGIWRATGRSLSMLAMHDSPACGAPFVRCGNTVDFVHLNGWCICATGCCHTAGDEF
jgi:hypothetical protein